MREASIGVAALIQPIDFADRLVAIFLVHGEQNSVHFRFNPVIAFLRLRRADMQEQSEAGDLPEKLQEFRLPVLQCVAADLDEELTNLDRLIVLRLFADEREPAEDPMTDQGMMKNPPVTQAKP
jgi:hypothetical protein